MMSDEEKQKMREDFLRMQANTQAKQKEEYELTMEKMRNREQLEKLKSNYNICTNDNTFFKYNEEEYSDLGFPNGCIIGINLTIFIISLFVAPDYCIIILIICYLISRFAYPNLKKEFYYLKKECYKHNTNLFKQKCNEYISENGVATKTVTCKDTSEHIEKLLVYDDKKELLYINMIFNKFSTDIKRESISCIYDEVLRYELIDKTTSQLIGSSSTTSSNAGKAIGGAIATGLLFGDGTTGAVIGGSGARKTNTTYQTKTTEKYVLNIYLNKLDNSIIKIETDNRDIISNIISIIEYIINSKNKPET